MYKSCVRGFTGHGLASSISGVAVPTGVAISVCVIVTVNAGEGCVVSVKV
jgi:hypothetical protein